MWSLLSVRLDEVENKLAATDKDFEAARRGAKDAKDSFAAIRKRRTNLFNKAYSHISESIDVVYKELTKGKASPMGGVAYLSLEDSEVGRNALLFHAPYYIQEPYLHGIKYHAMPPMKRFRDMEQLSGGEKTMAALALLFAIHS
jgi:structural maintenance of chromosome 1